MESLRQQFDIANARNALAYRITVTRPPVPAPPSGHPVLVVLDGDGYDGLFVDAARNLGVVGGEIDPPIVVAIGYPEQDLPVWMRRRFYDLTPRSPTAADHGVAGGAAQGGLDHLLDMISGPVLTQVGSGIDIDRGRVALFGHSLGGLAVVHAMFTRPLLARTWIAISPSLWWDPSHLRTAEEHFTSSLEGRAPYALFLAVGGGEQSPPPIADGDEARRQAVAVSVAETRMVDNCRELFERIARLEAKGVRLDYAEPEGETHCGVPFAVVTRALRFAFPIRTDPGEQAAA